MQRSADVSVNINLSRVQANAQAISVATGKPILAVIKADGYGLGAAAVAGALADIVAGFYVFRPQEAIDAQLNRLNSKHIVALYCNDTDTESLQSHRIHPVVWTAEQAARWRAAKPVLSIDTGQGRFACAPSEIQAIIQAGHINEAMTHATTQAHIDRFAEAVARHPAITFRHAAGSHLLSQPSAWFDAVRPGLALYESAVHVTTRLVDVRDSNGQPIGYTGFRTPRYGIILAGYSNGLHVGPCSVNGRLTRLIEVGMQSSFVELSSADQAGDEVELLGPQCPLAEVARGCGTSPQEALYRLAGSGIRHTAGS